MFSCFIFIFLPYVSTCVHIECHIHNILSRFRYLHHLIHKCNTVPMILKDFLQIYCCLIEYKLSSVRQWKYLYIFCATFSVMPSTSISSLTPAALIFSISRKCFISAFLLTGPIPSISSSTELTCSLLLSDL